jgi:hypothetical protein
MGVLSTIARYLVVGLLALTARATPQTLTCSPRRTP